MAKVSILMITYNREKFLSRAIDSIVAQSFPDWELIIVNDGSLDGTESLINNYLKIGLPIKYVKNEFNLGIEKSRNLSLLLATGEYIAILDSDDVWIDRNKLKIQLEFMKNNDEYVLLGTMADIVDDNNKKIGTIDYKKDDKEIRRSLLMGNQFVHSSVIYKRSVADDVGGYGNFKVGEDYDLFLKIGLKGKFANLPDSSVNYSKHSSGVTWENRVLSAREHLRIIKKYRGLYPNYHLSIIKANLRIILAKLGLL